VWSQRLTSWRENDCLLEPVNESPCTCYLPCVSSSTESVCALRSHYTNVSEGYDASIFRALYTFLHNLLNVLVQIANRMGLQKNHSSIILSSDAVHPGYWLGCKKCSTKNKILGDNNLIIDSCWEPEMLNQIFYSWGQGQRKVIKLFEASQYRRGRNHSSLPKIGGGLRSKNSHR
jgi:hypothetical protein